MSYIFFKQIGHASPRVEMADPVVNIGVTVLVVSMG